IQSGLNDPVSAAETAHQLVGLGGTYGFGKISELAQQIEQAIAKCELPEVTRLASELNSYAFELKRKYE
ncbi:MAG: Hpt domain-containing protein, partial [Verrucomicrobiota bacterium]